MIRSYSLCLATVKIEAYVFILFMLFDDSFSQKLGDNKLITHQLKEDLHTISVIPCQKHQAQYRISKITFS